MSLASRYAKIGSKNKHASVLSKSNFFDRSNRINLPVYAMNIAHSGSLFTGFSPGLIQLAGKSKHFKSGFMLIHVLAFQKKYPDGIVFFYDSEFGSDANYFENAGVNTDNVVHIPLENIEGFKFDIMKKLEQIKKDKDDGEEIEVMIAIDSIGNLASKKEVDDSLDEKSVADMTRAKQLKSLWRMVTPQLTLLGICCVAINHTYDTMEMYSKSIVSGGTGNTYSSNSIFIIGKRQIKDGKDLQGYSFVLNAEKSRDIKEASAIPIDVTYDGGINPYSGLLDIAQLTGHVIKPKMGWYSRPGVEDDKNWRLKDTNTEEFWTPLIEDPSFDKAIGELYKIGGKRLLPEDIDAVLDGEEQLLQVDLETGEILE